MEKIQINIVIILQLFMIITHEWVDIDDLGIEQPVIPSGGATLNYNLSFEFEQYVQ